MNSIVVDGIEHTLCYGDVIMFEEPGIFASRQRLYPSCREEQVVARLLQLNRDTIEGFGLLNGLTHSEYRADSDGTVYLIEAAARGGGSYVSSDIIGLQTGFDTSEYLINFALGYGGEIPCLSTGLCHCGTFSFYLPEGKVVSTEGVEEAKALTFIRGNDLHEIEEGMITKPYNDKTGRYISVLVGNSRNELMNHFNQYKGMIKIKVETKGGIKGPIWR